jgi:UDP-N-acetylglucosamine 2-epimerase (non-hydrolysing)
MPEEINRIITDTISSFLFVTEQSGLDNLAAEGVAKSRVYHVGNSMIDTLLAMKTQALARPTPEGLRDRYAVVTLHRPSNVDDADSLGGILGALEDVAADLEMVWPIHPRTEKRLKEFGLWERVERCPSFRLLPPIGYLDFMALTARATLVLTDSGGIQEEALVLKVPVVTMRENTERPVTIDCGGNLLAGSDPERIRAAAAEMLGRNRDDFQVPPLWDGHAGERIADVLVEAAS